MSNSAENTATAISVRSFEDGHHADVARLYTDGLLSGQIAANDTGADIDNIRAAYFDQDRNHFWVAEIDGKVVGMIGVADDDDHIAEIRRLRVEPTLQQNTDIAYQLVQTALHHCKQHGYLKIRLDTRFDPETAVDVFDRFGFQHTRTRAVQGKDLLEFYLDLYRQVKPDGE